MPSPSVSKSIQMANVTLPVPSELVAVIVKFVLVRAAVAVPVIPPVAVLKFNPTGNAGRITNELTVPLELVTTIVGKATFTTP